MVKLVSRICCFEVVHDADDIRIFRCHLVCEFAVEPAIPHPDQEKCLGPAAVSAVKNVAGYTACVTLYVPKLMDAQGEIAKIIGVPALRLLSRVYGGEMVVVPNRRKDGPRKSKILDMLAAGTSARDIALRLDVTQRYVEYLAKVGGRRQNQGNLLDMTN